MNIFNRVDEANDNRRGEKLRKGARLGAGGAAGHDQWGFLGLMSIVADGAVGYG